MPSFFVWNRRTVTLGSDSVVHYIPFGRTFFSSSQGHVVYSALKKRVTAQYAEHPHKYADEKSPLLYSGISICGAGGIIPTRRTPLQPRQIFSVYIYKKQCDLFQFSSTSIPRSANCFFISLYISVLLALLAASLATIITILPRRSGSSFSQRR